MKAALHTGVRPWRLLIVGAIAILIWEMPPPGGVTPQAWHLFALFAGTIAAILSGALPTLTASLLALSLSMLTRVLTPAQALAGFSQDFLLLIVAAFLVSRSVVRSGLGERIALFIIRTIGGSPLGLAYSVILTDALIAPAFPSNTARSGVLFPILQGLCDENGSRPHDESRLKLGRFLMMTGIASIGISSALWMTAMVSNPAGAALAGTQGVRISFGSWVLASSVPSLAALLIIPWLLFKLTKPGLRSTPEAPRAAALALKSKGRLNRDEWIAAGTFMLMIAGWMLADSLGFNRAAVAVLGLAVLMGAGVYPLREISREGEALAVWLWFGILYALSAALNEAGFMGWAAKGFAGFMEGWSAPAVYLALILVYVLMHYFFVSQTAHLLALYSVFLAAGIRAGLPPALTAYMLLFASNYFSALTPQGSSANVLYAGSGFLTTGELYRYGGAVTAAAMIIYLAVGTPWILLLFG